MSQASKTKNGQEEKEPKWWLWFAGASLVIVLVWWGLGYGTWYYIKWPERSGQFGDTFGFVNSLFSALSVAGVIITLLMQQHELKMQRDEMQRSIDEQTRSAEAQSQLERTQLLAAYMSSVDARTAFVKRRSDWVEDKGLHAGAEFSSVVARLAELNLANEMEQLSSQFLGAIIDRFPDLERMKPDYERNAVCNRLMNAATILHQNRYSFSDNIPLAQQCATLFMMSQLMAPNFEQLNSKVHDTEEIKKLIAVIRFWCDGPEKWSPDQNQRSLVRERYGHSRRHVLGWLLEDTQEICKQCHHLINEAIDYEISPKGDTSF